MNAVPDEENLSNNYFRLKLYNIQFYIQKTKQIPENYQSILENILKFEIVSNIISNVFLVIYFINTKFT